MYHDHLTQPLIPYLFPYHSGRFGKYGEWKEDWCTHRLMLVVLWMSASERMSSILPLSAPTLTLATQCTPYVAGSTGFPSHRCVLVFAASWAGNLLFDVMVFGLTLYKALTLPRTRGDTLLRVVFRDGVFTLGSLFYPLS